jgi:hypothetical protein
VKALRVVDTHFAQQLQRRFVLDAFSDGLQTERLGEADDGPHDVLVRRIDHQVTDELDVDLQLGDRQRLQVGEAAEPGAEVVEGQSAPELGQALRECLPRLDVLHERGLGDLEDEVRRISARLLELVLDEGQQVVPIEAAEMFASTMPRPSAASAIA